MLRQIDMDMIVVKSVRARRQHGGEMTARAAMHVHQKSARLFLAPPPIVDQRDHTAIGENETALMNIRDEMLALVQKTRYLLTQK